MVRTLKITITIRAKGVLGNWKYWKVRCEVGDLFCHHLPSKLDFAHFQLPQE